MHHTGKKKKSKKDILKIEKNKNKNNGYQEPSSCGYKNWLQGDLKPEPQNQLELKVNASIQWITTVNASIEFKRYIYIYIYIPSLW